jgi:hypothetical protein
MASLVARIIRFSRSSQGRQVTAQAKRLARDPATRRKIERVRERLAKRR